MAAHDRAERAEREEAEHRHLEQEHQRQEREASEPVRKPDENLAKESGQTVVDPRPTAPEIKLGDAEYTFPPAEASSEEVLRLEPNRYEDAVNGPDEQISMVDYTTWTRPDGGGEFLAPVANDETYERKGFVRGEVKTIPDLVAYMADLSKTDQQRETEQRAREAVEKRDKQRREARNATDRPAPQPPQQRGEHAEAFKAPETQRAG